MDVENEEIKEAESARCQGVDKQTVQEQDKDDKKEEHTDQDVEMNEADQSKKINKVTFDEAKLVQTQTAAIRRTDTVFGDNTDNLGDMETETQEMPEDMGEDFKDDDMDAE